MRQALIQGWTGGKINAEFAKATAELAGLTNRRRDAEARKTKAAALIAIYQSTPRPG